METRISPDDYSETSRRLLARVLSMYLAKSRLAILMSGLGTNARAILDNRHLYSNIEIVSICTDNPNSSAADIAQEYQLQIVQLPGQVKTPQERHDLFSRFTSELTALEIDGLLYAGFMKICPEFFVLQFPGINCHPGDLTIRDEQARPKYVGMYPIQRALADGATTIASTIYVVDSSVDAGIPLAVSNRIAVVSGDGLDVRGLHDRLKRDAEHLVYPRLISLLSRGLVDPSQLPLTF